MVKLGYSEYSLVAEFQTVRLAVKIALECGWSNLLTPMLVTTSALRTGDAGQKEEPKLVERWDRGV